MFYYGVTLAHVARQELIGSEYTGAENRRENGFILFWPFCSMAKRNCLLGAKF